MQILHKFLNWLSDVGMARELSICIRLRCSFSVRDLSPLHPASVPVSSAQAGGAQILTVLTVFRIEIATSAPALQDRSKKK